MTLERIKFDSREEGWEEGRAEGQAQLVSAIQKIKEGATRETLLSEGFDEKTVELAFACR